MFQKGGGYTKGQSKTLTYLFQKKKTKPKSFVVVVAGSKYSRGKMLDAVNWNRVPDTSKEIPTKSYVNTYTQRLNYIEILLIWLENRW